MKLTCMTSPTIPSTLLEEVKDFCRILDDESDAVLNILIKAAIDFAQNVTGRQLYTATYEVVVAGGDSPIRLPKAPLQEVSSVTCNGVALEHTVYYDYDVGFIEFSANSDVTITYTCGYDEIPDSLKAWVLNKVSTLYENRESIVVGVSVTEVPKSMIDCILDHYKVMYL